MIIPDVWKRVVASAIGSAQGPPGVAVLRGVALTALLFAPLWITSPAMATDVKGTFVAHVIEVVNCAGCPKPPQTISSPSADVTLPIEFGNDRYTIETMKVKISVPPQTPMGELTYGDTFQTGARIDFGSFGGSVPIEAGVTGNFSIHELNPDAEPGYIYAKGTIAAGGFAQVPRQIVNVDPKTDSNTTKTVSTEGTGNVVEVSNDSDGAGHGYPPNTRRVALTTLLVGPGDYPQSDISAGEVRIYTYYNFPTPPEYRSRPEPRTDISFETVPLGDAAQRRIHISNAGASDLVINEINFKLTPPDFSALAVGGTSTLASLPLSVPPGQHALIYLTWAPQTAGSLDKFARVQIQTNAGNKSHYLRGQSVQQPIFGSYPSPTSDLSFGELRVDVRKEIELELFNPGTEPLKIESIVFQGDTEGLSADFNLFSYPLTLSAGSSLPIHLKWKPDGATRLEDRFRPPSLRVKTNDPANATVQYFITGTGVKPAEVVLEEIIMTWLENNPVVRSKAVASAAAETATLLLDSSATHSLTAQVPAFLGSGSVQLNNFTGNLNVSLITIPGDSKQKRIRVEGGILTAPSMQLPSGAYTGFNSLIFGPPEESSGKLNVANGNYTAEASATIFNDLVPDGLTVRGEYSGVYNAQAGKISVNSNSTDLFESRDQLLNISTRMRVLTGDNVLIGGFIITGAEPKKVLIRGIGPSLFGVGATLPNPTLKLRNGDTLVASNDDWKDREAEIRATRIPPTHDSEAAILATLQPGAYTAIMADKNNASGVGVLEVYDLARAADAKLANISSRGFVDTGDNVMIGGFIVRSGLVSDGVLVPRGGARVLIRAIGPSLGDAGIADSLQNPTLELRDENGALVDANDDWRTDHKADIEATTIPPARNEESAIVRSLDAGNYTAIVRGKGDTKGIGLVEVYNLR